jgi:uncharacterized protein YegP (UPF0339 family)
MKEAKVVKEIAHYETYADNGSLWHWRLRSSKGTVVAVSPESYVTRESAEASRDSMIRSAELAGRK